MNINFYFQAITYENNRTVFKVNTFTASQIKQLSGTTTCWSLSYSLACS